MGNQADPGQESGTASDRKDQSFVAAMVGAFTALGGGIAEMFAIHSSSSCQRKNSGGASRMERRHSV